MRAPAVQKGHSNETQKRFLFIQKIHVPSTRAAIVGQALARVESKPWLVSMLLSENHDILPATWL
jgi:hypothetical protein